jgi:hypothetical protein
MLRDSKSHVHYTAMAIHTVFLNFYIGSTALDWGYKIVWKLSCIQHICGWAKKGP